MLPVLGALDATARLIPLYDDSDRAVVKRRSALGCLCLQWWGGVGSVISSAGRKLFGAGFYRGIIGIRRYGRANSGILPRDSPGFLLRILVDSSRVVGFLGFLDTTTTTPPTTTKPTKLRFYFLLAHCKRIYKKLLLLRSCAPACSRLPS